MSVLEKAIVDLANALDALEGKVVDRLENETAHTEDIAAARRQARSARAQTELAAKGVGAAIADLKALLETEKH